MLLELHLGGVVPATTGMGGTVVLMVGLAVCAVPAAAAGALWRLAMICNFLRSAVRRDRMLATTNKL